jgi:hypothetical protein
VFKGVVLSSDIIERSSINFDKKKKKSNNLGNDNSIGLDSGGMFNTARQNAATASFDEMEDNASNAEEGRRRAATAIPSSSRQRLGGSLTSSRFQETGSNILVSSSPIHSTRSGGGGGMTSRRVGTAEAKLWGNTFN